MGIVGTVVEAVDETITGLRVGLISGEGALVAGEFVLIG